MFNIRSIICFVLALLMLLCSSIYPVIAKSNEDPNAGITAHEPQTRMSEVKKVSIGEKSNKTWLWVLIGAVAIVAGVVAATSDGNGSSSDNPTPQTGSISGSW